MSRSLVRHSSSGDRTPPTRCASFAPWPREVGATACPRRPFRRARHTRHTRRPDHPVRLLLQRVTRATVTVDGESVGSIGPGLLVLVGVGPEDDESIARTLADKVV